MTLLNIFTLEDTKEEDVVSSLSEGEHIIGRGVTLNCNDKRISRKHALINVCKDAVTLKAVHINPCFFKAADGNSITILPKDTSIKLSDGDQFALLADQFWFKVRVIKNKDGDDVNCNGLKNDAGLSSNNTSTVICSRTEVTNSDKSLNNNNLSTSKRWQEDDLAETCKRQKISDENENEPTTSTSSNKNVSHENAPSTPSSPRNSSNLLGTSPNLEENIDSNQLINNLNNILKEDYGISKEKQKETVSNESDQKEAISDDLKINSTDNVTQVKKEKSEENVAEVKKEKSEENMAGVKIEKAENVTQVKKEKVEEKVAQVNEEKADENVEVKKENVSDSESDSESKDDKTNKIEDNEQNKASCSKDNPKDKENKKKSRRERCWYAHTCYRKNPRHLVNFSHPGDDDFLSDPDDDRPQCPFGDACYRTNLIHRREYRHANRPAPKPNDGGGQPKRKSPKKKKPKPDDDSEDDQDNDGARKKRKAAMKKMYADYDSADDDYDYNDPFIDDASSDEFELSSDEASDDSTDWEDSQKVDEESQETRRLLKEAKRFTKGKPKKKG